MLSILIIKPFHRHVIVPSLPHNVILWPCVSLMVGAEAIIVWVGSMLCSTIWVDFGLFQYRRIRTVPPPFVSSASLENRKHTLFSDNSGVIVIHQIPTFVLEHFRRLASRRSRNRFLFKFFVLSIVGARDELQQWQCRIDGNWYTSSSKMAIA